MANVTIEFDAANPLVVRIAIKGKDETHETDPTGWDINVSDEHFFRGKSHKEKMRERIELNKAIIDDWDTRKVQGAPAPHFMDHTMDPSSYGPGKRLDSCASGRLRSGYNASRTSLQNYPPPRVHSSGGRQRRIPGT
jgi:hypothetical protein